MQMIINRLDKQQGSSLQHGNSTQYPVINHNGRGNGTPDHVGDEGGDAKDLAKVSRHEDLS